MKILNLRSENYKRLSVVEIKPDGSIVTISGANGEGKSSVLDSIWAALGGADAAKGEPIRKGKKQARIEVKIGDANGPKLIVERSITEKGNYVTVKGADGQKYGKPETMLKDLMGEIAFDPPGFMRLKPKEQFDTLRGVVKLDVDLDDLDRKRAGIFEDRTDINRDLKSAIARRDAIMVPDDLPDTAPDRQAIVERLASASKQNELVRADQEKRDRIAASLKTASAEVDRLEQELVQARRTVQEWHAETVKINEVVRPVLANVDTLTAELAEADRLTEGFRLQNARIAAETEVDTLTRRADEKTAALETIDKTKQDALESAKMPVEGLGFADGIVTFKGLPLAQASAAEQLRVSAAIGAALNPKLRVLLVRNGSLLDSKSLAVLGEFATANDMQVWIERVDESGEVGIVMEDGHVRGQEELVAKQESDEAAGVTTTSNDSTPAAPEPGGEREQRAQAYLDAMLAALPTHTKPEDAENANAQVKVKLKAFPKMIAAGWTPAYLERLKYLTARTKK